MDDLKVKSFELRRHVLDMIMKARTGHIGVDKKRRLVEIEGVRKNALFPSRVWNMPWGAVWYTKI